MRGMLISVAVLLVLAGCATKEMTSGKIYMGQENWDKAIKMFSQEIEKNPTNAEAYILLGRAHAQKRDWEKSADWFKQAREIADNIIKEDERLFVWGVFNAAGEQAVIREDYDRAISYFTEALEIEPDSAATYTYLGYVFAKIGDTTNAIINYTIAIEKSPSNVEIVMQLALYYMEIERYENAIAQFREILEIDSLNSDALYRIGICHSHLDDFYNAKIFFARAVEVDPLNADAWFNLALMHIRKEALDEAIAPLRKTVEIEPEDAEAHSILGSIYLHREEFQSAVDAFTEAILHRPDDAMLYRNRAVAYFGLGETEKQEEDMARAEEIEKGER